MSFARLRDELRGTSGSFSPFFVLGDPTPELSVELAVAAVESGARMLELGLPFSDPIADGPEIAAAGERAMRSGTTIARALECAREIARRTDVPLNMLVYANLAHAPGFADFTRRVVDAGGSSLLCPDVSLEESEPLRSACEDSELGFVQLVGPATSDERLRRIDESATAFLYFVSHQGITGASSEHTGLSERVRRVTSRAEKPVCVGFGLSEPEHLATAFDAGARIAIVGSALARRIRTAVDAGASSSSLLTEIRTACTKLAAHSAPSSC